MGSSCCMSASKKVPTHPLGRDVREDIQKEDFITTTKRNKLMLMKPRPATMNPKIHSKEVIHCATEYWILIRRQTRNMKRYSESIKTLFLQN